MVFSTYLGGPGNDSAGGVVSDGSGNLYVVGTTSSTGFPVQGALQATGKGGDDAFVAKIGERAETPTPPATATLTPTITPRPTDTPIPASKSPVKHKKCKKWYKLVRGKCKRKGR